MDRCILRYGYLLAALAVIVSIVPASGCKDAFTTAVLMIKGTDEDAEFKGLSGKKVAVVCRPVAGLTFGNPTVAAELARQVSMLLQTNVPKIKMIEQQKVAGWTDAHDWSEYRQVGKAVGAEVVVGIELQEFTTYQGQTLYQGKADLAVNVVDCANGKMLFEKSLPQAVYPPNTGIPTAEMPEREFRLKFLHVLADQVGRSFYAHDPNPDMLQDGDAM